MSDGLSNNEMLQLLDFFIHVIKSHMVMIKVMALNISYFQIKNLEIKFIDVKLISSLCILMISYLT